MGEITARKHLGRVRGRRRHRSGRGRLFWMSSLALTGAVVGLWLAVLRPVPLGGPAGYIIVSGRSMEPTFRTGDLVVTLRQKTYAAGDIVVYHVPRGGAGAGAQVIHRVVGGSGSDGFVVKGDNKQGVDPWRPKTGDVVGNVRLSVPRAGLALLFLRSPLGLALLCGLTTLLVALSLEARAADAERRSV